MNTILVLGSLSDPVVPRVLQALRDDGRPVAFVDEDRPADYQVRCEHTPGAAPVFRITGTDCQPDRPISAIFVRHAVGRTLDAQHLRRLGELQANLNRLLHFAECPRMNPPAAAYATYSKPNQLRRLANAGFEIPRTLVTNDVTEASKFLESCGGQVLFKAASHVMTLSQIIRPEDLERLALLSHCPTLFQEFIQGEDHRIHVIGKSVHACRISSDDEPSAAGLLAVSQAADLEPVEVDADLAQRCLDFIRDLGLSLCGIDFRRQEDGRMIALDANPFPQFTYYEDPDSQPLTRAVVRFLADDTTPTNSHVFA